MSELAPVAVFAFNRPTHLSETLSALAACSGASQTDVFVFADGPRGRRDARQVADVDRVLSEEAERQRFGSFSVESSATNKGLAQSVIGGVSALLAKHNRVIVIEDDVVVTEGFLASMNHGLSVLEHDKKIWSLSGYSPPIEMPGSYGHECYLAPRGASWGWATWQSRWSLMDWDKARYEILASSRSFRRRLAKGGRDLPIILDHYLEGSVDSWAIRWWATQCELGLQSVYPRLSLAINRGTDGSGTHSPKSQRYVPVLADKPVDFSDFAPMPNGRIIRRFSSFQLSAFRYYRSRVNKLFRITRRYRRSAF